MTRTVSNLGYKSRLDWADKDGLCLEENRREGQLSLAVRDRWRQARSWVSPQYRALTFAKMYVFAARQESGDMALTHLALAKLHVELGQKFPNSDADPEPATQLAEMADHIADLERSCQTEPLDANARDYIFTAFCEDVGDALLGARLRLRHRQDLPVEVKAQKFVDMYLQFMGKKNNEACLNLMTAKLHACYARKHLNSQIPVPVLDETLAAINSILQKVSLETRSTQVADKKSLLWEKAENQFRSDLFDSVPTKQKV